MFDDNETLGISESQHIRVKLKDRGQRPGVPVLQLSVEKLDTKATTMGGCNHDLRTYVRSSPADS
jgi:hypothetical protein